MKAINLKRVLPLLAIIFLTAAFLLTGCSKQETKTSTKEPDVTVPQENSQQNNSSVNTTKTPEENKVMNKTDEKTEASQDANTKSENNIQKTTIKIPTAQCDQCKSNIEKALNKVAGIKTKNVDVDNNMVQVSFDKSKTSLGKIENAIVSAGYDANDKKADPDAYSKLDDCCKLPQDRKKK